jgi:magnesium transporter
MLDNYKEVVEALEDTNESVIGHQTNYRLQILTVVSVVLLPLTLVASIFGMNVGVPGEGDINAFWALIALMLVIGLGLVGVFRWRRWL